MSTLPDELWAKILDLGTSNCQFTHRDLCSISIVSRQLNRLSSDPSLWSPLLSLHFANSSDSSTPPSKSLYKLRRSSVALNVWQPEVVRGSLKQIVEQCTVPIESRFSSLNMEIKVCKQQIAIYNKTYNDQKEKLKEAEEALKSLKYHPMLSYQSSAATNDCNKKLKKLKKTNKYHDFSHIAYMSIQPMLIQIA